MPVISEKACGQEITDTYSTGFDPATDGYNFQNYGSWADDPGHCYGVAMTAALFYMGIKDLPGDASCAYDLSFDEVGKIIHGYQNIQQEVWDDQNLRSQTHDLSEQYQTIKTSIIAGDPILVNFRMVSEVGGILGHATTAYKIEEYDDNTTRVYVYDPNFCFDGSDSQDHINWFTFDLDAQSFNFTGAEKIPSWMNTYPTFDSIYVVEPQLSHSDQFWGKWALPIWLAVLIPLLFIFLFIYRKEKQKRYREKVKATRKYDDDEGHTPAQPMGVEGEEEDILAQFRDEDEPDKPKTPRPRPKSGTITVESEGVDRIQLHGDDEQA